MFKQALKYSAKFALVGIAAVAVCYAIGIDPKTAASITVIAQTIWIGFQIAG